MKSKPWVLPALPGVLFGALCARGHVFASRADEAVFVLLARSLRSGRFASAGGLGRSVADHLPGWPALLALPAALFEGSWDRLWLVAFPFWLAYAGGAYALARRLLGADAPAAAVAALCALSPAALELSGAPLSDLPFAALAAWTLAGLRTAPLGLLGAAVGLGTLMRPQGAALAAAAVYGVWRLRGRRDAGILALAAVAPLAAWAARTRLVSGVASEYFPQWASQVAPPPVELLGLLLGRAPFGLGGTAALASAALFLASAGAGARDLLSGHKRADAAGPAVFVAGLFAMHLSWGSVAPRYALPLLPFAWACVARTSGALLPAWASRAAFAGVAAGLLAVSWPLARAGVAGGANVHQAAMLSLSRTAPKEARVESLACSVVELLANRAASCPAAVLERDAWLGSLARAGVTHVHDFDFERDGFLPAEVEHFAARRRAWAASWPGLARVLEDPASGAVVYAFKPGARERLVKAWEAYEQAVWLAAQNEPAAKVRARLKSAIAIEPALAMPRAGLAELEADPRRRAELFEEALARDPGSPTIAERLAGAREAAKARRRP